jgi:hypothetical protein
LANDYGRLSARDKARLKAARKRAGVSKATPPPVRGESAADKARVPVQVRARENFARVERGEMSAADFARSIAGLKPAEKKDLGSYSKARSERTQKKAFSSMARSTPKEFGRGLRSFVEGAAIGGSAWFLGDPDYVRGLTSLRDSSRGAKDTLMDRDASFGQKLNAAGEVAMVAGLGGGVGGPRRSLTVNDKTQQLPRARSKFTQKAIEDPADRVSAALMGEGKVARVGRRVLPTAVAEARVAKAAGRQQLVRQSRAAAPLQKHLKALPKEGSLEDVAHFWWAQLPKSERNAQGLQRVRVAQARELEEITSNRALEGLKRQEAAVKQKMREAPEGPERFALMREQQELKILMEDLPLRMNDIALSIAQLDDVIAKPPALQPRIIGAVQALGKDRRAIHEATDQLKPETADAREGLVSRWLDLEPTGEEAYIGHRLPKRMSGANPSGLPVSVGTGRVRTPQGVATENKLVLAKSGRLRASTHTAADDWRASQVFRSSSIARDDLAAIGKPFRGKLAEDEMLVNPKGRPVPPSWKTDKLAKLADEGADADELRRSAEEIVGSFLADPTTMQAMLDDAVSRGVNWNELRVVPRKTVDRYFGQFKPAGRSKGVLGAYDTAVDFTAMSIIFARAGYVPKNLVQNVILAAPHQGPRLIVNAPRAAQILKDSELRPIFQAEVGMTGATGSIGKELRVRGAPHKAANAVSKVSDDPLRITAIVHELANEGVIPKWNPVLSKEDKARILEVYRKPEHEPLINDVRSRGVEAMADFSRLTPRQRQVARRLFIIPGWLWAGSRYPFHFAATHPGRSAAIAYVAAGEPGMGENAPNKPITDYMAKGLPHYLSGFDTGDGKLLRTTSLNPVSTPWELAMTASGQSPQTVAGYQNPFFGAIYNTANKTVDSSRGPYRVGSYKEAAAKNAERLVPNVDYVRDTISPPDDPGIYAEDSSRWGRTKRELGVLPIKVDREEAKAAKDRIEGGKPAHVKDHEARMNALRGQLKRRGRSEDPDAVKASRGIRAVDLAKKRAEKKNGGDKLTSEQKARIALREYKRFNASAAAKWDRRLRGANSEDRWQFLYEKLREEIARPYQRYGLNMDGTVSKR